MSVLVFAAIGLAAAAGAAEAACSTANMAGKWVLVGQDQVCLVTVKSSGSFSGACTDALKPKGTLSVTSDCKVAGTSGGTSFGGRTEAIDPASALKPNLLVAASADGTIAFSAFRQ